MLDALEASRNIHNARSSILAEYGLVLSNGDPTHAPNSVVAKSSNRRKSKVLAVFVSYLKQGLAIVPESCCRSNVLKSLQCLVVVAKSSSRSKVFQPG